jgi:hypothetical protein
MVEKITQSFVLTPADLELISEKARAMGDASASAALRQIIREWEAKRGISPDNAPAVTVKSN